MEPVLIIVAILLKPIVRDYADKWGLYPAKYYFNKAVNSKDIDDTLTNIQIALKKEPNNSAYLFFADGLRANLSNKIKTCEKELTNLNYEYSQTHYVKTNLLKSKTTAGKITFILSFIFSVFILYGITYRLNVLTAISRRIIELVNIHNHILEVLIWVIYYIFVPFIISVILKSISGAIYENKIQKIDLKLNAINSSLNHKTNKIKNYEQKHIGLQKYIQ